MNNISNSAMKIVPESTILILENNDEDRTMYETVLCDEGHTVFCARSIEDAYAIFEKEDIDLLLLSYQYVKKDGEHIVLEIKKAQSRVRIIFLFDEEDALCRRAILQNFPVHGGYGKDEPIEILLIWIDISLQYLSKIDMIRSILGTIKSQIKMLEKNKKGLRYIINAMPMTISRLQPLDQFIRGVLIQLTGFIDATSSFLATIDENDKLILLVGTGDFDIDEKSFLVSPRLASLEERINTIKETRSEIIKEREIFMPLTVKDKVIGIFYFEKNEDELAHLEEEMLRLFASQAAITIDNSNLFKLATIDGLTGLSVRRYFLQRFQEVLQFSSRYGGQAISLLLFDIDHFKYINDTFGHPAGDKVLSKVAEIIRESIRGTDITGRIGGEEFTVLLIDTSIEKAEELAESIKKKIEDYVFKIGEKVHPVTISVGVGNFPSYVIPSEALKEKKLSEITMHDVRRMLSSADKALYVSKENGRNRVTVSDSLEPVDDAK